MQLSHPINAPLGDGYGPRDPIATAGGTSGSFHYGQDYEAEAGTPIHAAAAGDVIRTGYIGTYGYAVYLDHGDGLVTRYAHMIAPPPVATGWHVEAGDVIGHVGSTGASTGAHLHFEVEKHGTRVNPLDYLTPTPKEDEMIRLIRTDKGNIYVVNHGDGTYWNVHEGIPPADVQARIDWLKAQGMIELQGLQPEGMLRGYQWAHAPIAEIKALARAIPHVSAP